MKCIVRNQDGINEEIETSVIRLEPEDVVLVKPVSKELSQIDYLTKAIRDAFPNNTVIVDINDTINIIKGGVSHEA